MYLYKIDTFPHQPIKSILKVAFLHRFHCKLDFVVPNLLSVRLITKRNLISMSLKGNSLLAMNLSEKKNQNINNILYRMENNAVSSTFHKCLKKNIYSQLVLQILFIKGLHS